MSPFLVALCAGLWVGLQAAAGHAEPPLDFSVLTYNTHGLSSWVAGDAPEARFPQIGALSNEYDVVMLQEDFAHHAQLRTSAKQAVIERGSPSRFGSLCPICAGDGLTLLTRLGSERLVELARVPYSSCSGWLGDGNDCLATKGFVRAHLTFPGIGEIDFVNTHLDAGGAPADRAVRRAQLGELMAHLEEHAADSALVLAGDLNLDFDDPEDRRVLDPFVRALRLRDSGATHAEPGVWTRLDYIFVRDGGGVAIDVLEAGQAREFATSDGPLSDHPALFARLRARAAPGGSAAAP